MVYIGLLIIVAIAWIINKADEKRNARSQAECVKTHQKMYDLIDEHYGHNPALAREKKAYTDTFIHGVWRESGRNYSADGIAEVTDAKERRERTKALENGTYEAYEANSLNKGLLIDAVDNAIAEMRVDARPAPVTSSEDGISRLAHTLMDKGFSYPEAVEMVENCNRKIGGVI